MKYFCDEFSFSIPSILTGVFNIILLKKIKYQPKKELNFLKKNDGHKSKGSPSKQHKTIPRYNKKLKIRDFMKIT